MSRHFARFCWLFWMMPSGRKGCTKSLIAIKKHKYVFSSGAICNITSIHDQFIFQTHNKNKIKTQLLWHCEAAWQDGGCHYDVIKWKHFPRCWPFVWGIHWSLVNSPHKGQWCVALVFSLICTWTNHWVNNKRCCRFEMPSHSLWHHCNGSNYE